jgi:hypothetical protein
LDLITLANDIINAATHIDAGRKGFATKGKAEEGRINYEDGIERAMSAFQEAQTTADPQTIILAEYTFLSQELEFCEKTYLHSVKYRINGFPRDAFQLVCISHKIHLQNVFCPHRINILEKNVREQRAANMTSAQTAYLEKQREVLDGINSTYE